MTRVAFVAPSLNGGGAERAAVTVLNALDDGVYAKALYLFRREGPYLRDVSPSVELVSASGDGRVERVRQLSAFIGRWRPDIVVSFLSYFSVYAAMRLAGSRARFVINQQTPVTAFLTDRDYEWRKPARRRGFELVARRIYPRSSVIATSRGVADDLVACFGVRPDQIATIPNPVDLSLMARAASEAIDAAPAAPGKEAASGPLIVTAGRLADAKNWPLFVAALAELKRDTPFRAWILGTGEREADIRQRLDAAGLAADVTFWGFQTNPWKYMARADVFVLTSRYEGFGNVLVEAMACGVPVVATASPGTREIVRPEVNGLLVESHEPGDVAAALRRVLRDRVLRDRMREGARATASAYDTANISASYDRLFQRLVA